MGTQIPFESGTAAPTFRLMSIVAKRLNGSGYHLVGKYASAQAMSDGNPVPPRKGAQQPPHFSAHFGVAQPPNSAAAEHLLHSSRQRVPILYNGPPLFPSKLPVAMVGSGPHLIHGSLGAPESSTHTTSDFDRLSGFCRAHNCDRQTDRQTADRQTTPFGR